MKHSADRGCQLCHVNLDGGEPWNLYGFEIRDNYIELFASNDIKGAIESIESNDSDSDPQGRSNLEEIQLNPDPGWSPGPTNTWIYKDGLAIEAQFPPFSEPSLLNDGGDELCLPIITHAARVPVVCL